MWNVLVSMIFATIEGLAVYALMLYIFRFDLRKFIIPVLIIITLTNLQSYLILKSTDISYVVPVINILFSILFMKYIAGLPIIGALASGAIGFLSFSLLQFLIVSTLFGSLDGLNDQNFTRYQIQLLTGVLGLVIGKLLYKFGIGFTNEFERLEFKFERPLIYGISLLFLGAFIFIMYSENLLLAGMFFIGSMALFLYYAIKKEREH
ncbi:hypothetical protein D3P07_00550 [Paenibacillus sp. 1011MAR3C5]|uniref:hypothetical protein n=1 Tax=Paenibacillus sp. 1011MAR3C5 TaxID=1675787 RepID=UPI000E6C8DA6|nr:hypothetical protein [Paenibacillus sp. 1011MAR3C5]RJE90633.1 hypothetical protein D3P07_00550 [Paenibacillus sp. 1011MAR3C5]